MHLEILLQGNLKMRLSR